MRHAFADYFEYLILRLSHPLVEVNLGQSWQEHRSHLERIQTAGRATGLEYNVVFQLLNAAEYGVPQRRDRVFIVGFRSDLGIEWAFPLPTHSYSALVRDKWITGEYWGRHGLPKRKRPNDDVRLNKLIERLGDSVPPLLPWRTVRDAIDDLPKLRVRQTDPVDDCHFLNPGARTYHGHTGCPLDEPAKTLKAGSHGVPGGENTLIRDRSQGARYFSVRECARLQTFPDDYTFFGTWTSGPSNFI